MISSAKDIQLRELKDTLTQLKTMVSEQTELIQSLRLVIDEKSSHEKAFQEQVDYLTKKLFGSSSERRSDDILGQLNLFDEAEQDPFVPEEEQICPVCGTHMVLIGEEYVRRKLEFIPATCKVIEYYSQSYGWPACKEELAIRKNL